MNASKRKTRLDLIEDFKTKYGETALMNHIKRAGIHLEYNHGESDAEKLAFALLEILAFPRNKYKDYNGLSDEEIKQFLLKHQKEVRALKIEPPSYIGAVAGVFSFLAEK